MTTVILVGLIVVLLAAAAYVGVLLLRRTRSTPAEPGTGRPRTVADLVKRRTAPDDAELSGDELFVPVVPRQDGVAVPAVPDESPAEAEAAAPSPQPATPAGGLEVGDAPWRRAARMAGAEPGGTWATAPLPVVAEAPAAPEAAAERDGAGADDRPSPSVVIVSRAAAHPTAATLWGELDAMRAAVARHEAPAREHEEGAVEPALDPPAAASPWTEPDSVPAVDVVEPADTDGPADTDEKPADPAPVSRPLSDPDLTPLMGIPIIRSAGDAPAAEAAPELLAAADEADEPDEEPVVAPVPRTIGTSAPDDDVVFLLPPTPTASFPVVPPAPSGSPQAVWFRVVRRDGEPVSAAVVALLDDHGREVDTTKTAPDGGGELRTPHGGRFLMIVSADGHQPRAAILSIDGEPVELALLLPRSAAVSGSVRSGGAAMRDAHVVVWQDHDLVDEATTARDGHYRFDDLAEGTYTVAVTAGPSRAVARVSLAEGADVRVDLDLAGAADAR